MIRSDLAIITTAVTGSVHVPSQSRYLPTGSQAIADAAIEAASAGSAVVHLHARHTDGRPAFEPEAFDEIVSRILSACDVVINVSTGGSSAMTMDERLAGALHVGPELASLNLGSMNFVYSGVADRVTDWAHDWEKPYVEKTYAHPFVNSFAQIEQILRVLGADRGVRFEFECYDIGHLYTLAHFVDRGLVEPPFFVQGVFGVLGGIGADHANLQHMVAVADKLFGDQYQFSAFAAGRHQMEFTTHSAVLGGHVRVGLEDNLWLERGRLARSSAEQVERVRTVLTGLGRPIATPDDARRILGLRDAVAEATPSTQEVADVLRSR